MKKMFTLILMFIIIIFSLNGCSQKQECPPAPDPIIDVVYETKEVMVETPCVLPAPIKCDFKGEGYIPSIKLLECVIEQKRMLEYCTGKTKKKEEK
jgi:hypothetical protein